MSSPSAEPRRSRRKVLAAALFAAVCWGALAALLAAGTDTWWGTGLVALLAVSVIAVLAGSVIGNLRTILAARRLDRPARFAVTDGVFAVPVRRTPGLAAVADLILTIGLLGGILILLTEGMTDRSAPAALVTGGLVMIGALTLSAVCMAVLSWPGLALELTPEGVRHRAGYLSGEVPWAALAQGPQRPAPGDDWLALLVARPELVVRRGWALGLDSATRVFLPLGLDTHPWLLADAIRWYVEHPEHRAAIGTQAEHDRLLAALAAPSAVAAPGHRREATPLSPGSARTAAP